jgi:hypothetical protein
VILVKCCCLTTFPPKHLCICIYTVTGVSCLVTKSKIWFCTGILFFRMLRIQSGWRSQSNAVALQLFIQNIFVYVFKKTGVSCLVTKSRTWFSSRIMHFHILKTLWLAILVKCCCLITFPSKYLCICIYNVAGVSCLVTKSKTWWKICDILSSDFHWWDIVITYIQCMMKNLWHLCLRFSLVRHCSHWYTMYDEKSVTFVPQISIGETL